MNELLDYLKKDLIEVNNDIIKGNTDTSDFNYHLEMLHTSIFAYLAEFYSKNKRNIWNKEVKNEITSCLQSR